MRTGNVTARAVSCLNVPVTFCVLIKRTLWQCLAMPRAPPRAAHTADTLQTSAAATPLAVLAALSTREKGTSP